MPRKRSKSRSPALPVPTQPPTIGELAEFACHGLRYGFIDHSQLVLWADSVIDELDEPPIWAIELSMSSPETAIAVLKSMQRDVSSLLSKMLFVSLLRRKWLDGSLEIERAIHVGWLAYRGIEGLENTGDWTYMMSYYRDLYENSQMTKDEITRALNEQLEEFEDYDQLLPQWALTKRN